MDNNTFAKVRNMLISAGVFVECKRGLNRKVALRNCFNAEVCPRQTSIQPTIPDKEDPEDDDDDDKSIQSGPHGGKENQDDDQKPEKPKTSASSSSSGHSKGLDGLMKAYNNRKQYSGNYEEDLVGSIEIYEMTANMCELSDEEMKKGIITMLNGPALTYYATHLKHCQTYTDVTNGLISWFASDEQRARLLNEWNSIKLSEWLEKFPEKPQTSVFQDMSSTLTKIQRQLHDDYKKERFLKDRLVASADIPEISKALKEKPPSSQEAVQRIAALLSSKPRTADSGAYYGLGKRYLGQARRKLRPQNKSRDKKKSKLSMIKGCWVCGKSHFARDHHSPEEIERSIERLKSSGAYLSIEDAINAFYADDRSDSESDGSDAVEEGNKSYYMEQVCDINQNLVDKLSNQCFTYGSGFQGRMREEYKKMEMEIKDNNSVNPFKGILIDPGANYMSMISLEQYSSYCKKYDVPASITAYEPKSVNGVGGKQICFGLVNMTVPFPNLGFEMDFEFHITDANVPTLRCLRDLKRTGLGLDIQNDTLHFMGKSEKLELRNGLLWYEWTKPVALYSEKELFKLHRSFGHPSVTAMFKLLKRARLQDVDSKTYKAIKDLTKSCRVCARHDRKPKRFKLTVGAEDLSFNHIVAIDTMFIDGKPILHMVDEATHFSVGCWLKNSTSAEVWKSFLRCWSLIYVGPPDYLRVDQGTNYTSKEFKANANSAGITILEAPVESPNTMSHVERYHGPLRTAYQKLKTALPKENKVDLLQMAIYSVNNTVGPEGLCPTLCVFGTIPKPDRTTEAKSQIERARDIDESMKAVDKYHSEQKIRFASKYKGPYGK